MATLASLPAEVLATICSFLPGCDIARLGSVCKAIHQASRIDSVWQGRCAKEYKIPKFAVAPYGSYFNLYSKVLHHYGFMLGLWQADLGHYGGLFHGKCTEEGSIILTEYYGVKKATDPLHAVQVCKAYYSEESRETRLQCGVVEPHSCNVTKLSSNQMSFLCTQNVELRKHSKELAKTFSDLQENAEVRQFDFLWKHKFVSIINMYQRPIPMNRLIIPSVAPNTDVPIRPGLFKGTYGGHGIEIMMLSYPQGASTADITKVTGDPNVPAGKVSISANLNEPLYLSAQQQNDFYDVSYMEKGGGGEPVPVQPFILNSGLQTWTDFDVSDLPKQCTARFITNALVAGDNHTNPQHILGHWVVFDEDTFAHIWFKLHSVSLFKRITCFSEC